MPEETRDIDPILHAISKERGVWLTLVARTSSAFAVAMATIFVSWFYPSVASFVAPSVALLGLSSSIVLIWFTYRELQKLKKFFSED